MNKLKVAIIGQGRSGLSIHGNFFRSEANRVAEVVAVVDAIEFRREKAKKLFNCDVYEKYTDLFGRKDIDLVVNSSFSHLHAPISRDLLLHGFNVLTEKPMARTWFECQELIRIAEERGLVLAAFQQSLMAPNFRKVKSVMESGIIGDVHQISVYFNGFGRRWDWQTMQCNCAGGVYNTGPHPIGQSLALLGWDPAAEVQYVRMGTILTSGDANDYAKIILTAPGKPVVDIEIDSADAFSPYTYKLCGSKGGLTVTGNNYKLKYIKTEELEPRPVIREPISNDEGSPIYCSEKLNWYTEEGTVTGDSFGSAVEEFYEMMYARIREGKPLYVTPEMAAETVRIIEYCHAKCPLPVKYAGV